jgi:hypothetical protein
MALREQLQFPTVSSKRDLPPTYEHRATSPCQVVPAECYLMDTLRGGSLYPCGFQKYTEVPSTGN